LGKRKKKKKKNVKTLLKKRKGGAACAKDRGVEEERCLREKTFSRNTKTAQFKRV